MLLSTVHYNQKHSKQPDVVLNINLVNFSLVLVHYESAKRAQYCQTANDKKCANVLKLN